MAEANMNKPALRYDEPFLNEKFDAARTQNDKVKEIEKYAPFWKQSAAGKWEDIGPRGKGLRELFYPKDIEMEVYMLFEAAFSTSTVRGFCTQDSKVREYQGRHAEKVMLDMLDEYIQQEKMKIEKLTVYGTWSPCTAKCRPEMQAFGEKYDIIIEDFYSCKFYFGEKILDKEGVEKKKYDKLKVVEEVRSSGKFSLYEVAPVNLQNTGSHLGRLVVAPAEPVNDEGLAEQLERSLRVE